MSVAQTPLASSWRRHRLIDHHCVLDGDGSLGSRRCPSFVEIRKFVGRERSSSVLSFNWKEENLLQKKLSFLESMKKYEANAWLREQKAFYRRYQNRLQTLELEHARLLGNKDLVQQLMSQNKLSNYTSTLVDESESAVKAIVQARAGRDGRAQLGGSGGGDRSLAVLGEGLLEPAQAAGPPGAPLKADPRKERCMTVTLRGYPPRGEDKPAPAFHLDILAAPELRPQPRRLLVDMDSRPVSTVQSLLPGVDGGRKSKDRFLQYVVWGDRHGEPLVKLSPGPRNSLRGPVEVQVTEAFLTRRVAMLGRQCLGHKGARCPEDGAQSCPWTLGLLRRTLHAAAWGRAARACHVGQGPECPGPQEGDGVVDEAQRQM